MLDEDRLLSRVPCGTPRTLFHFHDVHCLGIARRCGNLVIAEVEGLRRIVGRWFVKASAEAAQFAEPGRPTLALIP